MDETTKFVGKSKTLIGALLIFLATVAAPLLGLDFNQEDAKTLTDSLYAAADQIVNLIGLVLVVWGRVSASKKVAVFPNPTDNVLKSPWWIAALAATLVLPGCVGGATFDENTPPVAKIRASYDSALPLLAFYSALPPCGPDVVGLCSKPAIVDKLNEASVLVESFLVTAESVDATDEAKAQATKEAQRALSALLAIYAAQAITKS